jgi:hypothetical protein
VTGEKADAAETLKGRQPITKGSGLTGSERKLVSRCESSFLRLWSWPNVFRDDAPAREICDVLVVFGNQLVIFSDKDCAFPDTGDTSVDWSRWFKKAVLASAEQVWGAERWIRSHPDRVFTDSSCRTRVPFSIDINEGTTFHRVVVARGSARRTEKAFGGSGSLMVDSKLKGTEHLPSAPGFRPFTVGNLDPSRGFIHVVDDATFDILLDTLDTIDDFTRYLSKKQALFEGPVRIIACGEEDLLARYLRGIDKDGEHGFRVPERFDLWALEEGGWRAFESHPERLAQKKADEISYTWDRLIDKFASHQLEGTSMAGGSDIEDVERALRIMAAEPRTHRRMLSRALLGALEAGDHSDRFHRVVPGGEGKPTYVFLTLKRPQSVTDEAYRRVRRRMLGAAITIARVESTTDASCVVGIATGPLGKPNDLQSEDLGFLEAKVDDDMREEARREQRELRIWNDPSKLRSSHAREYEYPLRGERLLKKGRSRNEQCPCGSGNKVKRCCGSTLKH